MNQAAAPRRQPLRPSQSGNMSPIPGSSTEDEEEGGGGGAAVSRAAAVAPDFRRRLAEERISDGVTPESSISGPGTLTPTHETVQIRHHHHHGDRNGSGGGGGGGGGSGGGGGGGGVGGASLSNHNSYSASYSAMSGSLRGSQSREDWEGGWRGVARGETPAFGGDGKGRPLGRKVWRVAVAKWVVTITIGLLLLACLVTAKLSVLTLARHLDGHPPPSPGYKGDDLVVRTGRKRRGLL
ncbi:uncharacterized protein LOC143287773 [Babylonia areolata]|uniref:uncharacterized protein LOC143287773 n=1 Tax=Babylonia areolata TaxID=304850 RepID=UPI003FD62AC2